MDRRREIAITALDAYIDVLCAWRGRYEDDERPVGIAWIMDLIPECQPEPRRGWLCVKDTETPGIGWELTSVFRLCSLSRSFRGMDFCAINRRQFREAAKASGVVLPPMHATLYLREKS
jgi:hypothetical protein